MLCLRTLQVHNLDLFNIEHICQHITKQMWMLHVCLSTLQIQKLDFLTEKKPTQTDEKKTY